jgi:hypothetical protein
MTIGVRQVVVVSVYLGALYSKKEPRLPGSGDMCSVPVPVGAEIREGRNSPMSLKAPSCREPDKLVSCKPGKPEAHLVLSSFSASAKSVKPDPECQLLACLLVLGQDLSQQCSQLIPPSQQLPRKKVIWRWFESGIGWHFVQRCVPLTTRLHNPRTSKYNFKTPALYFLSSLLWALLLQQIHGMKT